MRKQVACGHFQRLDVQRCRRRSLTGRNEDVVVVTDDERQVVHIVQGIAAQVNLSALTLRKHDTIVADACMLAAKTTNGNRLHTPCPTIVAQGDARHVMQSISNIGDSHNKHVLTINEMLWHRARHHLLATRLCNSDALQMVSTVGYGIRLRHSTAR